MKTYKIQIRDTGSVIEDNIPSLAVALDLMHSMEKDDAINEEYTSNYYEITSVDESTFVGVWGNWDDRASCTYETGVDSKLDSQYFNEGNGYEVEDIQAIHSLQVHQIYWVSGGNHFVVRVS